MLLSRIFDADLAQAAYLIACDATRNALIVDPMRDVEPYLRAAAAEKVTITHVAETHIHADFISGARELARRTGARLLLSGEGGPDWQYAFAAESGALLLRDGDVVTVGTTLRIDVRHTPGHTPEHLAFLVTDTDAAPLPVGMVTGDFVFVGDVGRPDLLERAANVAGAATAMAAELHASLRALADLPDYLQLWPGHGAGSACGKALGALPSTTLGYERITNWALRMDDGHLFVRRALEGQPTPPSYFATMKRLNRDGPPPWPQGGALRRIDGTELTAARAEGARLVDVRPTATFADAHLPGSINIPLGTSFSKRAGSLLDAEDRIVLLDDSDSPHSPERARRILSLIGYDRVTGWGGADLFSDGSAHGDLEKTPCSTPGTAATAADQGAVIIDVRDDDEWRSGHIPGARHIPLLALPSALDTLPQDRPIILHCQGGGRSAVAASLLLAEGFGNVSNMTGGMDAWLEAGLPTARDD